MATMLPCLVLESRQSYRKPKRVTALNVAMFGFGIKAKLGTLYAPAISMLPCLVLESRQSSVVMRMEILYVAMFGFGIKAKPSPL